MASADPLYRDTQEWHENAARAERAMGFPRNFVATDCAGFLSPEVRLLRAIFGPDRGAMRRARKAVAQHASVPGPQGAEVGR